MSIFRWYGLNRTICDVIAEVLKCHKTRNYSMLPSLMQEMQLMADRMEAALSDLKDLESLRQEIKKAKNELKKLEDKKESND